MLDNAKMLDLCSSSLHIRLNLCSLPLGKKYRGHFEIIALLLEAVKDTDATGFSIMKHANVNCNQLKKYLLTLTEIGFIEVDKKADRCLYKTSEKGLDFLRQYHVLLGMLLNASADNKSGSIVYGAEYDAAAMQRQAAAQLVTLAARSFCDGEERRGKRSTSY